MSIGVNLSSVNSDYWGGRHIKGHTLSHFLFPPIATSPGLGGDGCKAVPVERSVQPCSRCRQVGSLRTGGKGRASGKELQLARPRYRLGPRYFFFGVMKRRGRSCCFWFCEGRGSRGSSQLSR